MSTPSYAAYVREIYPRGVVLVLSPLAADPGREPLTRDFGLQLLLEAQREGARSTAAEHASVFDQLYRDMMPRSLTLPAEDPLARRIASSGRLGGQALLSATPMGADVCFTLERDYDAFCSAAQHYVYFARVVHRAPSAHERGEDLTLALAVRFPWLVTSIAARTHWESTAYSFAGYATA